MASLEGTISEPPAGPAATAFHIRAVEPSDSDELRHFYATLSATSRYRRFLGMGAGIGPDDARRFCRPDHAHAQGFVAMLSESGPGDGAIMGHLCLEPGADDTVELAIVVADRYQRRGMGRRLVAAGRDWAERSGIGRLEATMFADNGGTVALLRSLDRPIQWSSGAGVITATVELRPRMQAQRFLVA